MSKFWDSIETWLKNIGGAPTTTEEPVARINGVPTPVGVTAYPNVPAKWQWITRLKGLPQLVREAIKEYGTVEGAGTLNSKKIIGWADEIARCNPTTYNNWAADWYNKDSVPWCGLFMALCTCRSANGKTNRMPVKSYLSALAWANWGVAVNWKTRSNIWCGDIAVFVREGGGHVAVIIGVSKDGNYVLCCGGNQDDQVNIKLFPVSRLYAVRRPPYVIRPTGARHISITTTGTPISTNEG